MKVDGSTYYLLPDTDVDKLSAELLAAGRRGGDVVQLDVVGMTTLRVVVTPGAPIIVESEPDEEVTPTAADDDPPTNLDYIDNL